jgi:ATP-dependent Lhr-like helicase
VNLDTASPGPGDAWFAQYGWTPFAFQREVWAALAHGRSGLLHASTGSGKTYAVWFGALARAAALGVPLTPAEPRSGPVVAPAPPLGVLWLTPMRALAADTARALQAPDWDLIAQPDPGFACDQRLSR